METTNPAKRFLALFDGVDLNKARDENAGKVWAKILRTSRESEDFLPLLGKALRLPLQIEDEIKNIPNMRHEVYLSWSGRVKRTFFLVNLESNFSTYADVLDVNTRALIAICEEQLSRLRPQPAIPVDKLRDIAMKVEQLLKDVKTCPDLPPSLQEFIHRNLHIVESAINDYRIQGSKSFVDSAHLAVGSIVVNREMYEDVKRTPLGERFTFVMAMFIFTAISTYPATKEICSDLLKLLPSPDHSMIEVAK